MPRGSSFFAAGTAVPVLKDDVVVNDVPVKIIPYIKEKLTEKIGSHQYSFTENGLLKALLKLLNEAHASKWTFHENTLKVAYSSLKVLKALNGSNPETFEKLCNMQLKANSQQASGWNPLADVFESYLKAKESAIELEQMVSPGCG